MTRDDLLGRLPKHSVGAEIGVARANFSLRMLRIVEPHTLYLVDRYALIAREKARPAKAALLHMAMERLVPAIARGQVRMLCTWSLDAVEYIDDGALDWVYIDADHHAKAVYDDLCVWYPKVKPGGIVAGHDYRSDRGPWQAVRDFAKKIGMDMSEVHATTDEAEIQSFYFRR